MQPFITGSRAYGTPKEESDIDIVLLVESDVIQELQEMCDQPDDFETYLGIDTGGDITTSIRFGKLNMILHTRPEKYNAWKEATDELIQRKPVARDEAVKCIQGHLSQIKLAGTEAINQH